MLAGDLSPVAGIVRTALADARFWAASILLPFAHFGDAFIEKGREISALNEQTRISFEVLMGSVEKADALLTQLIDYAAHTPFELPQLFNVTQGLVAFGDSSKQVMEHLKMMGDVSGGVHEKFQILGIVFNQIRAEERLLIQDFKQLSIRGMLFITDLAEYLGVTKEEAKKMQRAGKISFEDVRGTLMMLTMAGHRFHNMMQLQSQSIIGLTATLKDSWGIFASKIADSLIPLDRVILKIKIELLEAMSDLTEATHGFAGGAMVGAVAATKLALAITAVSVAVKILGVRFKVLAAGAGIAGAIITIGAALGGLVSWFLKTEDGIRATEKVSKDLRIIWKNLKMAAYELYISISEGFYNAFGITLPNLLGNTSKVMADWIITVSGWFVKFSENVLYFVGGLGFAWRNAFDLAAISGLDLFTDILDGVNEVAEAFNAVADVISKSFRGAFGYLGGVFENFLSLTRYKIAQLTQWMKEQFTLYSAMIEGLAKGMSWNEVAAYASDALDKVQQEVEKPNLVDPSDVAREEYNLGGGFDVLGDFETWKKKWEEEKKLLQDRINDRERRRRDPNSSAAPPGEGEGDRMAKRPAAPLIDPGRYGFVEFGNKIQDAFLKGKSGDLQQKMVDLLGIGNGIQQKLLDGQNKNGGLAP